MTQSRGDTYRPTVFSHVCRTPPLEHSDTSKSTPVATRSNPLHTWFRHWMPWVIRRCVVPANREAW